MENAMSTENNLNAAMMALDNKGAIPSRMRGLPINETGYLVPWFAAWLESEGKYDLRVVKPGGFETAWKYKRCWLCGQPLGRFQTFVIGPMCTVNRVSSEPPCHHDCATFAAIACPFLTRPNMVRNSKDLPAGTRDPAEEMIQRNPGATALWTTKNPRLMPARNGYLIDIGDPMRVEWYAAGREATRQEVWAAIESGIPLLEATLEKEPISQREAAKAEIAKGIERAKLLLPA